MNPPAITATPWKRHNLARNPFGELTRDERARLAVIDLADFCDRLAKPNFALQFVGDCGRGKTTRLLAIADQFPDSSYVYLPEDGPTPPIPEGNPLLIDEAQRLPRRVRTRLFESGIPLVLATHRDLTRSLKRHGYEVHTEQIGAGNDARLIRRLLNIRIEASRLGDGPTPIISDRDSRWLSARFGSDIRSLEHYLYERIQTQVMSDGEVRFVD